MRIQDRGPQEPGPQDPGFKNPKIRDSRIQNPRSRNRNWDPGPRTLGLEFLELYGYNFF